MEYSLDDIAIIGMAGRFPGADNLDEFWQLIRSGKEALTFFSDEELLAAGLSAQTIHHPCYIKAGQIIERAEWFDAAFFGFTPREAEIIDPQQRMFLEQAWAALEDAGYDPETYAGQIGVYAGATSSNYLFNVYTNQEAVQTMGYFQISLATEKDHLPMRVSYKLNLKGPSITVQTACSTSLVAVHLACEGLLGRQCDMALAGAVTLRMPQQAGYQYEPGGVASEDGHCRPFSAAASGTVFGNGIGIVVLKRLEDALADHDTISAVIKSSAINNDGSVKIGYSAPSIEGQSAVIAEALALADIEPESISYLEAHGTGTPLGDPIEIAALNQTFRASTTAKGFCALGAIKANIGHLECASGMAGLIKTVLALRHRELPPQPNFGQPNPKIDFANSPFYVNTALRAWPEQVTPRRAGVSSFGMGGTNAHVVVEEGPNIPVPKASRAYQLLVLSARSAAALQQAGTNLASHLEHHPEDQLADIAFTLQRGRRAFSHRQILVCADKQQARQELSASHSEHILKAVALEEKRPLAFLFPGQGTQYVNMARRLYETESFFRGQVEYCARFLKPHLGLDLCQLLYPEAGQEEQATAQLRRTAITQPALFVIEYTLARLWMSWGLQPQALLGHSIGEYAAACVAGALSLEDALTLVAVRGRLIQQLPAGAMLSVSLPEDQLLPYLNEQLSLAAVNSPDQSVVSGPIPVIGELEQALQARGHLCHRLHTSHAFHSAMLDAILPTFETHVRRIRFRAPAIRYLSNVTGTWITEQDVREPAYWVRQLRQTVLFAAGIETLITEQSYVLLEVGPGQTLSGFARSQENKARTLTAISSLRHPKEVQPDDRFLLNALGKLWLAGIEINWDAFYGQEQRQRISLPTYPFERQPYYLPLLPESITGGLSQQGHARLYTPTWQRVAIPRLSEQQKRAATRRTWILFTNQDELGRSIAADLTSLAHTVVTVVPGTHFACLDEHSYTLNPAQSTEYQMLAQALSTDQTLPLAVLSCWHLPSALFLEPVVSSLRGEEPVPLWIIGEQAVRVESADTVDLTQHGLFYDCVQLARDTGGPCRYIDHAPLQNAPTCTLLEQIYGQILREPVSGCIALRGTYGWEYQFTPVVAPTADHTHEGVYVLDPHSNQTALSLASYLAQLPRTRLAVVLDTDGTQEQEEWGRQLQAQKKDLLLLPRTGPDPSCLTAVISTTEQHFGAITGFILALPPSMTSEQLSTILPLYVTTLANVEAQYCLLCGPDTDAPSDRYQTARTSLLLESFVQQQSGGSHLRWLSVRRDSDASQDQPDTAAEGASQPHELLASGCSTLEGPLVISMKHPLHTLFDCWFGQPISGEPSRLSSMEQPAAAASGRAHVQEAFVAPRTATERRLATIWEYLLGIEHIGVFDNFFELGGHSLLATQIIARLREAFSVELAVQDIFTAPTIARFASLLEEKRKEQQDMTDGRQPTLGSIQRPDPLPASLAQRRLWFFDQLETLSSVYNIPTAVRLKGRLRDGLFEPILTALVQRHESLRTTFSLVDQQVIQHIQARMPVHVKRLSLLDIPAEQRDECIKEVVLAESSQAFNLATGPLLHATLLTCAPDEHVLVLTLHHIISDAWSLGILVQELVQLYEAFIAGKPSPLLPLALQAADVTLWQQRSLQGPAMEAALAYWKATLADSQPYVTIPADRPRPLVQTYRGANKSFLVPQQVASQFIHFSQQEGKTLFTCLLAAFNVLLFYYSGQSDLNVGTAVANRNHVAIEKLIGFFVDTVVVRTTFTAHQSFRELVQRVDTTFQEIQAQQPLPFELVVDTLKLERDPAYNPLFQTAFVMQNTPEARFTLHELMIEPLKFDVNTGSARFDLLLDMGQVAGQLIGFFEFNTDLFHVATVTRMIALFQQLLALVAATPDMSIGELVEKLTAYAEEQQRSQQQEQKQHRLAQLKRSKRRTVEQVEE